MNRGFAAIITILVIGLTAAMIGVSLILISYQDSLMSRSRADSTIAFYAAQAGIEEGFAQIQLNPFFGNPGPDTLTLMVDSATADITISGTEDERIIEAIGTYNNYVRKITVETRNTTLHPGFLHAVHAGQGGFDMRHNTLITGKSGTKGNIYSNGSVRGAKNEYTPSTFVCKNAASKVNGSVWAVGSVDKLETNDTGLCVTENIYAGNLLSCAAAGTLFSPSSPSPECSSKNGFQMEPSPEPMAMPEMGVTEMKAYLTSHGTSFLPGNCIADGSNSSSDCTYGTGKLGSQIIEGNLIKPSNTTLNITGPLWVKGDVIIESNGGLNLDPNAALSQLIVVDGKIISNSNVTYSGFDNKFLLFVTLDNPGVSPDHADFCKSPAISISSNSQSVLFYATSGCIEITANSTFYGAVLGQKIFLDTNSTIEYDPALGNAVFGLTESGGWQTVSFKES